MDPVAYCQALERLLVKEKNPVNASQMFAYMKNQFSFYGVKSPDRREIQKRFLKEHGLPDYDSLEEVVRILWEKPEREFQMVAMDLTDKMKRKLEADFLSVIEFMIVTKSWWDTVDYVAATIAGNFFKRFQKLLKPTCDRWNDSPNMWLNRSAILVQLKYKETTDTQMLSSYIKTHKDSKEFFHRKAIGWALRQYARTDPTWVLDFVNTTELSPLSRREALKHLSG